jgi:hypothetical protein
MVWRGIALVYDVVLSAKWLSVVRTTARLKGSRYGELAAAAPFTGPTNRPSEPQRLCRNASRPRAPASVTGNWLVCLGLENGRATAVKFTSV